MSSATPTTIASGLPYEVVEVAGRTPTAIEDFVGTTGFLARRGDETHHVPGQGVAAGTDVRFHEKAVDGGGKDVRVWTVRRTPDGAFAAEHAAVY